MDNSSSPAMFPSPHPKPAPSLTFDSLAPEILQRIAFFAASFTLGPPENVLCMMLTCKSLSSALSMEDHPYLYDRIFRMKFDVAAPQRRLEPNILLGNHSGLPVGTNLGIGNGASVSAPVSSTKLTSSILANELKIRYHTLKRIRRCEIDTPHTRKDLWIAYLMMLESDGRNEVQLFEYASVARFVYEFLKHRLYEGSAERNNGWPIESQENALAVWLFWLVNDARCIAEEPDEIRGSVVALLRPFLLSDFKYQAFLVPDIHFYLPLEGTPETNPPRSLDTLHGPYPIYRPFLYPHQSTLTYFGQALTIAPPPLVPAALLSIFVRLELNQIEAPPECPERREDLPPGMWGITVEDCIEFNQYAVTRCVPRQIVKDVVRFNDEDAGNSFKFGRSKSVKLDSEGKGRQKEAAPDGDCRSASTSGRGLSSLGSASTDESAEWRLSSISTSGQVHGSSTESSRTNVRNVDCVQDDEINESNSRNRNRGRNDFKAESNSDSLNGNESDDHNESPNAEFEEESGPSIGECIGRSQADTDLNQTASQTDGESSVQVQFSSQHHEHEWLRLTRCYNPWLDAKLKIRVFTPGMLDGCWEGRMFGFDFGEYSELLSMTHMPPNLHEFPYCVQRPLQMVLREHHCLPPNSAVSCGGDGRGGGGDGFQNAYFPSGTDFSEKNGKLIIKEPGSNENTVYETYTPDRPNSHHRTGGCELCLLGRLSREERASYESIFASEGVGSVSDGVIWEDFIDNECIYDIIVTGETSFNHGRAWGINRYYGRVRDADGLIVILRIPNADNNIDTGTQVFRGYIHSMQNFCGRFRSSKISPDVVTAYTGSFSMSKRVS